jgi:hypothetical protein
VARNRTRPPATAEPRLHCLRWVGEVPVPSAIHFAPHRQNIMRWCASNSARILRPESVVLVGQLRDARKKPVAGLFCAAAAAFSAAVLGERQRGEEDSLPVLRDGTAVRLGVQTRQTFAKKAAWPRCSACRGSDPT